MREACACGADSVCEGSECVRGAWLRCAVGCWVASDTAGWDGGASIWLLVGLETRKQEHLPQFRNGTIRNESKRPALSGQQHMNSGGERNVVGD